MPPPPIEKLIPSSSPSTLWNKDTSSSYTCSSLNWGSPQITLPLITLGHHINPVSVTKGYHDRLIENLCPRAFSLMARILHLLVIFAPWHYCLPLLEFYAWSFPRALSHFLYYMPHGILVCMPQIHVSFIPHGILVRYTSLQFYVPPGHSCLRASKSSRG